MTKPKADAVVVAYRSEAVILSCVEALRSDPAIDRIIVVDNYSLDSTGAKLFGAKGVDYVDTGKNLGFGRAINLARSRINAPYVVLANPDTQQDATTTSLLLEFLRTRPRCAMVGPRLFTPDGGIERNSQHELRLSRMLFQALGTPERAQVMRSHRDHRRAHETECLIGAFVAARVEALDDIGWFDESIFLFGEDQDLCRRLRAAGWEIWFAPVGRVRHLDGHSWRQLSDSGSSLFRTARERELRQTSGSVAVQTYRVLVKARDLLRRLVSQND